jgi:hypothetical protein
MVRFAPAFVSWYGDALDAATFAARLPVVGVALLWAAFLFRWAADWFGPWGGLAALTLFVFDPNILAHATLATNDVGFAAFSFIALFAATRLLRRLPAPHSSGTLPQPAPLRWRSLWSATRSGTLPQPWRYVALVGLALGGSLSSPLRYAGAPSGRPLGPGRWRSPLRTAPGRWRSPLRIAPGRCRSRGAMSPWWAWHWGGA